MVGKGFHIPGGGQFKYLALLPLLPFLGSFFYSGNIF